MAHMVGLVQLMYSYYAMTLNNLFCADVPLSNYSLTCTATRLCVRRGVTSHDM